MNDVNRNLKQNQPPSMLRLPIFKLCLIVSLLAGAGLMMLLFSPTPARAQGPVPLNPDSDWFSLDANTTSVAWGDVDGDGDLDLAVGNYDPGGDHGQTNRLYLNQGGVLGTSAAWSSTEADFTTSVAWGDVDGDGDLDLAVGNSGPNRLYLNQGGALQPTAVWTSTETDGTLSVAWGDVDGDGDLDLAVGNIGPNRLYLNQGGALQPTAVWTSTETVDTGSVAWGDVDGDGDLDLAVGNKGRYPDPGKPNRLYLNEGLDAQGNPQMRLAWTSTVTDHTTSVAWGDVDGDGDLDLAVGRDDRTNKGQNNCLYLNEGLDAQGNPQMRLAWTSTVTDATRSVAWGDVDGDGDLDLAVGNAWFQNNQLYLNEGLDAQGNPRMTPAWSSTEANWTEDIAWGDVDGDGDLDLAVGNSRNNRLHLNQGGVLGTRAAWTSTEADDTRSVAWGDVDGDGDLDLAAGNFAPNDYGQINRLYLNQGGALQHTAVWTSSEADRSGSVAWGDVDGDGDLDLAVGNIGPNRLYLNQGLDVTGALSMTLASWSPSEADATLSVAWGDVDGDGDLDLAVGNIGPNRLYLNQGGALQPTAVWTSTETVDTWSVAWGDVDGDGDLDLAVGNKGSGGQNNELYLNHGGALQHTAVWTSTETDETYSVAWGDVDGDGDLDLAVGNNGPGQNNRLYLNQGGVLGTSAAWSSSEAEGTRSVAWGDVDGDGDLDLAVGNWGQNRLYLNQGGVLGTSAAWSSTETDETFSVAWGDVDGDGDLDLAVGNRDQNNQLYLNNRQGGQALSNNLPAIRAGQPYPSTANFYAQPAILASPTIPLTYTLFDPEGDPVGRVVGYYSFNGGGQWFPAVPTTDTVTTNLSLGGALAFDGVDDWVETSDFDIEDDFTISMWTNPYTITNQQAFIGKHTLAGDNLVLFGFYEDSYHFRIRDATFSGGTKTTGWQHLAVVGEQNGSSTTVTVYKNGEVLWQQDFGAVIGDVSGKAWTIGQDWDGNVQTDFFKGRIDQVRIWNVARTQAEIRADMRRKLSGNEPGLVAYWPLDEGTGDIVFDQTSNHSDGSLGGGVPDQQPRWVGGPFATYAYTWDTFASGFFGQSDNVVMRLLAYPQAATPAISGTYRYPNSAAGPFQRPYASATTFPFRVRGTQVQVISGSQGISNALVYRLPAGDQTGGFLMGSTITRPFVTDDQGFLQGRGQLEIGDRLLALVPVQLLTDTQRFSTTLSLYYTNIATITETGLQTLISNTTSLNVSQPGVQQLQVSAQRPLLLFDLDVSLEWDASHDPTYLDQLEFDLKRASQHLFDFTDGQVALGDIWVYQDADRWSFSHINVHATNRLRPYATVGGAVLSDTLHVIPELSHIDYGMGQVHMGSTWNRYGNPAQSIGMDWPLVLAHELGHYLLFLEDTYLGLELFEGAEVLTAVDSCTGSAMGDVYSINNTEFIFDRDNEWLAQGDDPNCTETLAEQELRRDEWQIIRSWYPALQEPTTANPGPSQMPYNLTTVSIFEPLTATTALADPTFYLDYEGGEVGTSEARAFLLRNADGSSGGIDNYEYVYDLGNPVGGQNRVLARGAQPDDRLCVFDQARSQFGCEIISFGDERLALIKDETWQPVIQISPVNSTTFDIEVEGLPGGLTNLKARLYPEYGEAFAIVGPLLESNGMYIGTLNLDYATLSGNLQLWADNPRRETIVTYRIGGNPGSARGGGGSARGGGGSARGGGGSARGGGGSARGGGGSARGGGGLVQGEGGAPAVSPDGQMTYFDRNFDLAEGQFYTVQDMAGLPELPTGKVAIGRGYNLFATGFVTTTNPLTGSVSFQYLGNDVLTEEKSESELGIHFWEGSRWLALKTSVDQTYNLASAASEGPGVYALLAGTTTPVTPTVIPAIATVDLSDTQTITLTGGYYLEPVEVKLTPVGSSTTYILPATWVSTNTVTARITPGLPEAGGLPAREYEVVVTNKNQPGAGASLPGSFALFDPAEACFYDFFESGSSQWQTSGDWGIVILPSGERAMTDSPLGTYDNAITPTLTLTTAVTPVASLNDCSNPVLTFRHDYVIDNRPPSQDVARVEISTDNGNSWTELVSYRGGYDISELETQDVTSPEWTAIKWKNVQLNLSAYTGTVRLRFSLAVDQVGADKGWIIDDIIVKEGSGGSSTLYLPLILKQE